MMTIYHRVLSALLLAGFLISCTQKEIDIPTPQVSFSDNVTADYESATITCSVNGNVTAEKLTVQYSKDSSLSSPQTLTVSPSGHLFSITLSGLEANTTYYYRYTISNKISNFSNGAIHQFQTMAYSKPEVKTIGAYEVTARSATLKGEVTSEGGRPVLEKGFYLGKDRNNLAQYPIQSEDFAFTATELEFAATYYYQAYARNEMGFGLGEVLTFTTRDGVPQLQVNGVTEITSHSALIRGEIQSDGGSPISERGFCYSDTEIPTINSTKVIVEGNDTPFGVEISDLKAATTYQIRVFAVNDTGLYYGETISFSTLPIEVTSVTLDKTELTLSRGEKASLTATVYPEDATDKTVQWSSNNPEVAYSDQLGTITTLKGGTTTIIAKSGNCSASCVVTVIVPVADITLNPDYLSLEEGQTYTLTAWIMPQDATDQTITWTSQDPSVASVDNGVITAIKEGSTSIRAQAGNAIAHCAVVVKKNPKNEPISFADSKIKEKLVAAFDTNGDGELSYREAAKVTSLENVFGSETDFTSFDEFQYFTGINGIDNSLFMNWVNLESITLPNSIQFINGNAFLNCYKLKMISFPASVSSIGTYAFYGCTGMEGELILPEQLERIGSYAFASCTGLSGDLVIPQNVKQIDSYAFSSCNGLNGRLLFKSTGTLQLGAYAFTGCSSFTGDLVITSNISLGNYTFSETGFTGSVYTYVSGFYSFYNCKIGENLVIEDNVADLQNAFRYVNVGGYIYIGKGATHLGSQCFSPCTCNKFYVAALAPPACDGDAIQINSSYLGVPPGRVEAYLTAAQWGEAWIIAEADFSKLQITPPSN